jgi:hypothetical protein
MSSYILSYDDLGMKGSNFYLESGGLADNQLIYLLQCFQVTVCT